MAIGVGGLRGVNRALALACGLLVFGFVATCFETRVALAQDWSFESNLSQRMGYNSNLLLNPDNEISGFSSQTTPQVTLNRVGPTSDIAFLGRVDFNEYINNSEFNSIDEFGSLDVTKQLSERSTLKFYGDINHDTNLESDQDATGKFVNDAIRFTSWNVNPSWEYLLSPIDRLRLAATYQQVAYDTNEKTDYQDYGPTVTWSHDLSELASVTGSLNYSRFDPDDEENRVQDTYGSLFGYDYHPTERFSISGAAGLSYEVTHSEEDSDKHDIGYRFQFSMNYLINDQTRVNLLLSRDTEPSGDGQEVTRNRASAGVTYQMTEMTVFSLDASYIDDQETQSEDGVSRYMTVRPGVRWNITEDLSLAANYAFRYKTVENSGSAIDNGAFITLRYALPDVHWSGF
jgi:hypothetical protein